MANLRNEFEFRSGLLDALGVEHTEADAKNEERWRSKMLDGLGVEYNQNDVNQFDLFRTKLLEGVESMSEGGGGSSDFSTAEVTLNIRGAVYSLIAIVDNVIKTKEISESGTYTVPLYKGVSIQPLPPGNLSEPPTFTGDIELSIEDFGVKVTGNGSITLVGSVS